MSGDTTSEVQVIDPRPMAVQEAEGLFAVVQRKAMLLCQSALVPEAYRGKQNIGSCVIALEMADRMQMPPLLVMQNLHIIHGRPSWSSQFIIAGINGCGRFSPLRYEMTGEGDSRACYAWAMDLKTGDRLEGPQVSIAMAQAEGWYGRKGSKWKTLPELLLRYRAAAFFGRLYAPELMMGILTSEEVRDIGPESPAGLPVESAADALSRLEAARDVTPRSDHPREETPTDPTAPVCDACSGFGVDPVTDDPCAKCGQGEML